MKTAVIFYSNSGSCALVAGAIKDNLGDADIFEIKTVSGKREGIFKIIWQIMRGEKPAVLPLGADLSAYDLLVLGSPVWMSSPALAMISFLEQAEIAKMQGRKLALFCCCGGSEGAFFDKFRELLGKNEICGELTIKGRDKTKLKQKVQEWLKSLP